MGHGRPADEAPGARGLPAREAPQGRALPQEPDEARMALARARGPPLAREREAQAAEPARGAPRPAAEPRHWASAPAMACRRVWPRRPRLEAALSPRVSLRPAPRPDPLRLARGPRATACRSAPLARWARQRRPEGSAKACRPERWERQASQRWLAARRQVCPGRPPRAAARRVGRGDRQSAGEA